MMYRILIASVFVAATLQTPVLRAQDKPAPPEVTFQVEVNYVDVDVVVTDENGKFVPQFKTTPEQPFVCFGVNPYPATLTQPILTAASTGD